MVVTSLKDYMAMERPDTSEPASFYVAGAENWEDYRTMILRSQQQYELIEELMCPSPEWDEAEDE